MKLHSIWALYGHYGLDKQSLRKLMDRVTELDVNTQLFFLFDLSPFWAIFCDFEFFQILCSFRFKSFQGYL